MLVYRLGNERDVRIWGMCIYRIGHEIDLYHVIVHQSWVQVQNKVNQRDVRPVGVQNRSTDGSAWEVQITRER